MGAWGGACDHFQIQPRWAFEVCGDVEVAKLAAMAGGWSSVGSMGCDEQRGKKQTEACREFILNTAGLKNSALLSTARGSEGVGQHQNSFAHSSRQRCSELPGEPRARAFVAAGYQHVSCSRAGIWNEWTEVIYRRKCP